MPEYQRNVWLLTSHIAVTSLMDTCLLSKSKWLQRVIDWRLRCFLCKCFTWRHLKKNKQKKKNQKNRALNQILLFEVFVFFFSESYFPTRFSCGGFGVTWCDQRFFRLRVRCLHLRCFTKKKFHQEKNNLLWKTRKQWQKRWFGWESRTGVSLTCLWLDTAKHHDPPWS